MPNPIVLIHGYSDRGESFKVWKQKLAAKGLASETISICSYVSLSNEVTIKDIAEGLNRALAVRAGLQEDEPFDAIVHSTGMLVIRSWLANYPGRVDRLKHLVALAPATYGSPLAHKGRSWLGSLFKGNKDFGPDFMEAGDLILDGLELGSRFTWDLAHVDLLGDQVFYGPTRKTPYVFIFCGSEGYGGLRRFVNEPGTDGTVRWAGCGLNTRKIVLDLTREATDRSRVKVADWTNVDIPTVLVDGHNHGTIISEPSEALVGWVVQALGVSSKPSFEDWQQRASAATKKARAGLKPFQQFVVHAVDERGDGVRDYNLQLFYRRPGNQDEEDIRAFDMDVHAYKADPSYRCFHVDLSCVAEADSKGRELWIRFRASTGTEIVSYRGFGSEGTNSSDADSVELNLSALEAGAKTTLFFAYTTTLLEIRLNREPMPPTGESNVLKFLPD